jgi:hypothetical protein
MIRTIAPFYNQKDWVLLSITSTTSTPSSYRMRSESKFLVKLMNHSFHLWTTSKKTLASSHLTVKLRSKSTSVDNSNTAQLGLDTATVIKGPSLLTATGIDRPSPSLFLLPGLRSLPFWTAPYTDGNGQTIIAFQDPKVTSIVRHIESFTSQIREEYISSTSINPVVDTAAPSAKSDTEKLKTLVSDYDINTKGGEHASDALHTGQVRADFIFSWKYRQE